MAKKKEEIDINILNPRETLEEAVLCSILGRPIASLGATLTGREKRYAELVYRLLTAEKEFSDKLAVTAYIDREPKPKKPSPSEAIKWFAEKYPKDAQPLLAKLQEQYGKTETSVAYGLRQGKSLPDERYVKLLKGVLQIPEQLAVNFYYTFLKPLMIQIKSEEGLTKLVMK